MRDVSTPCPLCGAAMEQCDYSPLYGYSWIHPKAETTAICEHSGKLVFSKNKPIQGGTMTDTQRTQAEELAQMEEQAEAEAEYNRTLEAEYNKACEDHLEAEYNKACEDHLIELANEIGPQESKPPDFKVGDWVEYSDGTLQQAIIGAYSGQPGEQMVYVWHPQTAHSAKTPLQSITRKLDPSEVVVHIGCLKGTVAPGCSDATIMIVPIGYNGFGDVGIIPVAMLDALTRSLVEKLLKAQEEQ